MSWPWRSPTATRHGLAARTASRFPPELRQQRQREIAYRRLMFRLFAVQPERWVVKGGAALLLRLDPNRTSNDIDLAYVAAAGEHAVAVQALEQAADFDAGDFFRFEVRRDKAEQVDADHPLERALSVPVTAYIGPTPFARFSIDLALPQEGVDAERLDQQVELIGEEAVDAIPGLAVLTLPAQVADKVCAVFERHGDRGTPSSRARDLADLAMISAQKDLDGTELVAHLQRERDRRQTAGTLPEGLPGDFELDPEQTRDWEGRWSKASRGAPLTFQQALEATRLFVTPILNGTAAGKGWSHKSATWEAT